MPCGMGGEAVAEANGTLVGGVVGDSPEGVLVQVVRNSAAPAQARSRRVRRWPEPAEAGRAERRDEPGG